MKFPAARPKNWLSAMRRIGCLSIAAGCLAGGDACSRYHPKPLTSKGVDSELATPGPGVLRMRAAELRHPLLPPLAMSPGQNLTPDTAAVLAVLLNPSLRAVRDQRRLARAQLLQAGILPNPQLSFNPDFVTGGNTAGTFNAYGLGLSWEITSLLTRDAKIKAAQNEARSVDLDIAWQEWQTALGAQLALLDLAALEQQLEVASDIDQQLAKNASVLREAVERHQKSIVDFAAADAAAHDAHSTMLDLQMQRNHQRMLLRKAIGLPPGAPLELAPGLSLPNSIDVPAARALHDELGARRLDLRALSWGYESQEQTVRAAVLAQFPKITLGYNQASDTTNVHTSGFGVTVDLPIFDRNQGGIAVETATRQRLYDEYLNRVFIARSDVAVALGDIQALTAQVAAGHEAISSLQRLVDTYKRAYDRGNADVVTYYTAVTTLKQKTLDVMKLQQQLWENQVALELAAGWYLPTPVTPTSRPAPAIPAATEPHR